MLTKVVFEGREVVILVLVWRLVYSDSYQFVGYNLTPINLWAIIWQKMSSLGVLPFRDINRWIDGLD